MINDLESLPLNTTIGELLQMHPGKLHVALKAKVVHRPNKVNDFMNIKIEDERGEGIQCCLFGQICHQYRDILQTGVWYRIEEPVLQANNRTSQLELKITKDSKIFRLSQQQERDRPDNTRPTTNNIGQQSVGLSVPEYDPKDYTEEGVSFRHCYLAAYVVDVFNLRDMGRELKTVDKYGNRVKILLWNDNQAEVRIGETYKFSPMKVKIYRGYTTLQSVKGKTEVTVAEEKITDVGNKPKTEYRAGGKQMGGRKLKILRADDEVVSLGEALHRSTLSQNTSEYYIVFGYLQMKNMEFITNNIEYRGDNLKKLFYFRCDSCVKNHCNQLATPQPHDGKAICSNCAREMSLMWSVKCCMLDQENELKSRLNDEISFKLIDLKPIEAIKMIREGKMDEVKEIITRKCNFLKGVYKMSAKAKDGSMRERFWNIMDAYEGVEEVYERRINEQYQHTHRIYEKMLKEEQETIEEENRNR